MEHRDVTRKLYIGDLTPSVKDKITTIMHKNDEKSFLKYMYNNGMPFGFIIFSTVEGCNKTYTELYENWINVQRPKGYVEPVQGDIIIPGVSGFQDYNPNLQEALRKQKYSYSRSTEILKNINLNQLTEYERQIQLIYDEYVY
jgi:hypothetical protein